VETIEYRPRKGFQEEACLSEADFLLTGGQAGPGKTWWICYDAIFDCSGPTPQKMIENARYTGVIFRRQQNQTDVLLRDATPLYNSFGGKWRGNPHNNFLFPSGARVYIAHLHELEDWTNWKGYELHFLGFDELSEFLEYQVQMLLPWLRSTVKGVRPRFAATTNPEGEGLDWVKRWWNIKCPCRTIRDDAGKVLYQGHDGVNVPFQKEVALPDGRKFSKLWHFIPGDRSDSYMNEMEKDRGVEGEYEASLIASCGGSTDTPRYKALGRGCWEVVKSAFFQTYNENIHVIPDDFRFNSENWAWMPVFGHDFATAHEGDACAGVLISINQNRDVIVEAEDYAWGLSVEQQKQRFSPLKAEAMFSGADIFRENQGGEIRRIDVQFRDGADEWNFMKYKQDIPTTASLVFSALMATIRGHGGCLYIRERCVRLRGDFTTLMTDKKKYDRWDVKQRITINGNQYHFDVFQAFCAAFCGGYAAEFKPVEMLKLSGKRVENLRKAKKNIIVRRDSCQYSL